MKFALFLVWGILFVELYKSYDRMKELQDLMSRNGKLFIQLDCVNSQDPNKTLEAEATVERALPVVTFLCERSLFKMT